MTLTLIQSSFISSRRVFFFSFVDYLAFSTLTIMLSANNSSISSYLTNIPLIYFSCLISLARTLNRNDERRYLCLVTFLRGEMLSMRLAVDFFVYTLLLDMEAPCSSHFLRPIECWRFILIWSIERFDLWLFLSGLGWKGEMTFLPWSLWLVPKRALFCLRPSPLVIKPGISHSCVWERGSMRWW